LLIQNQNDIGRGQAESTPQKDNPKKRKSELHQREKWEDKTFAPGGKGYKKTRKKKGKDSGAKSEQLATWLRRKKRDSWRRKAQSKDKGQDQSFPRLLKKEDTNKGGHISKTPTDAMS